MNDLLKISLFILYFSLIVFPQSKNEIEFDSLSVVWGKTNYSGNTDCGANASISSDGRAIHIKVNVIDDHLVLNKDPINSDHVELWFSLPDILNNYLEFLNLPSDRFIISDSSLFLIKGHPDLEEFNSFLLNPLINSYDSGIDSFYYNQIKDTLGEDYDWLKESIDTYFQEAKSSNLYVNNFPLGIVHFGLLPKQELTIQYDKEFYLPLERFTNTKLEDLSKYLKFSSTINKKGYSLDITIDAKALGFISKYGVNKLNFLIDIIDVDVKNKQETLLSTSKNRVLGEPRTFNEITFSKPIDVKINNNIKLLGNIESNNTPYDEVIQNISNYFVKTDDGWTPIDIREMNFYEYNQPEIYLIEDISKIKIQKGTLNYKQDSYNNNLIEYFKCSYQSFVILNKKQLLLENGIIKLIHLPYGKIAFLYSDYDITGRYTKQISSYLYLVTDSTKQIIASYLYDYPPSISIDCKNIGVQDKWDYNKLDWYEGNEENIPWINVINYNNNDQYLILNLADSLHYKVQWDENGKIIK